MISTSHGKVASVEKKSQEKVTIYFFHNYYTPESNSVHTYFCFVFVFGFDIFYMLFAI
jgi:hypothetical protein